MDTKRDFTKASLEQADHFGVTVTAELLSAILVWTLVGWGLDAWLNTGPWLLVTGIVLGASLGFYLVYLRYVEQSALDDADRPHL